jgi:uncharacterized repeat protein (TIGR01451 family)
MAPAGYGTPAFVRPGDTQVYEVRFENKADATAPAREIVVTDILDATLDLSTFELFEIGFGAHLQNPQPHTAQYQSRVPMKSGNTDLVADVKTSLDYETRQLKVTLTALDAQTGWYPEDPLVGLLPPEDGTGRGQGHITYFVKSRPELATGTLITNKARIVFDYNDPIDTPLVSNTIDAGSPSSSVRPLPATSDRSFLVQWSGQDDPGGSGIADYDVFVSSDGANYARWLQRAPQTSAMFTGVPGTTYSFYTVARDNVGHEEPAIAIADASTTVNTPFTLGLTVESLPASALVGNNFTYRVVVANQGPRQATNVVLTHTIDAAFAVVAAVPSQGTLEQTGGLVTARFGALAAGAAARLNVELIPQSAGTFTNRLDVTSDQGVIAAADVVVPVSTVPPRLGLSLGADTLTFTWPVSATAFLLESAGSLSPPIPWAPVTNEPVVVGDLETLRLQPTNGTAFYRLRWAP